MVKYFLLILSIMLVSCIPYYFDEYGNSIPKNPRYSLKDKKGFTILDNLDTFNIYKRYGYYDVENNLVKEEHKTCFFYKKFYPNGRYYFFCVEKNKNGGKLKEEDLNPFRNRDGYYYCNKKRNVVKCETFVIAKGGYM